MDVEEQRGDDLDLGGGEQTPGQAEDPLAGVPAGPVEDVSEGPDEERLGGDGAGIGEEPKPGEFVEEPEEPEDAAEPEPTGEESQGAAEEPEPSPDPESSETSSASSSMAASEPAFEGEKKAAEPKAEPKGEEPQTSGKAAKPKAAKKAAKGKTPSREYKVLRIVGSQGIESPLDEPVKARNGDDAIKEAYKALSKSGEETMTLVAIPVGYFKEKEVKGREKKDYAVEVK